MNTYVSSHYYIFVFNLFFPRILQTCAGAYDLLLSGEFGAVGRNSAESYRQVCQKFFPYATKFNLNSNTSSSEETQNNNVNENDENERSKNDPKITNNSSPKAEINEP